MENTTPAAKPGSAAERTSFRAPWTLRIVAAAGIAVPVGMLVHVSDVEQRTLSGQVEQLRGQTSVLGEVNAVLSERAVEADRLEVEVADLGQEVDDLSGQIATLGGQMGGLKSKLQSSERRLDRELGAKVRLEREVDELSGQVAALGEREKAMRGIIGLLEGEVESAERRLEKLAENGPQPAPPLTGIGLPQGDGQAYQENDRLRNELRKHDDQLVELLAEISSLNQELEIARGEQSKLGGEANGLSNEARKLAAIVEED